MSLQIVSAMQSLALVLLSTRAPALAIAVVQRRREALEVQWRRASGQAMSLMAALSMAFVVALSLAVVHTWPIAERVLSVAALAMLATGSLMALAVQCAAVYLRAHKLELLTPIGVGSGMLYGLTAWAGSSIGGAMGVVFSYLAVTALVTLPLTAWIFTSSRRKYSRT